MILEEQKYKIYLNRTPVLTGEGVLCRVGLLCMVGVLTEHSLIGGKRFGISGILFCNRKFRISCDAEWKLTWRLTLKEWLLCPLKCIEL